MGPGSFGKWISLPDLDLHCTVFHDLKQIMGVGEQILPFGSVGHKARPRKKQRTLGCENAGIEQRNRTGGLAKTDHHAHRPQTIQGLHESFLAHGIIYHVNSLFESDLLYPRNKILISIEDRVITTLVPCVIRLLG